MFDSIFLAAGLLFSLAGVAGIVFAKLLFKKSIMFNFIAVMVFPILVTSFIGFIVGIKGLQNVLWGSPTSILLLLAGFAIVYIMLKRPLNEMQKKIDLLSKGDLNISFNEKFLKGNNELSAMMRTLSALVASFKKIASFAHHVGKGELNTEYELLGENDTLGHAMLEMRSNLLQAEAEKEERQREDERRNWATQGVAKFAELLRANNDNIEELSHSIIKNLVKYIGAIQGGIFILNDDDPQKPVLELNACYAYERRKFVQKTIELGDGLVGTCFLEGESTYITDLPKKYISITSGLGKDSPRALLIVPLKVNGTVHGIVEIAGFKEFEPHVRDFVEKVSESIASTISSVKVNMKTNNLLEQTKLQAEEMANQDEELRLNMEEMQSTQEEMLRRETELHETLEEVKKMQIAAEESEYEMQQFYNAIIESNNVGIFSADGIVIDVNQNLLNLWEADKSVFTGHHYSLFVGDEGFSTVWKDMVQGKKHADVRTITSPSGKQMVFRHNFIPVCNKKGELLRVLLLAFPDEKGYSS